MRPGESKLVVVSLRKAFPAKLLQGLKAARLVIYCFANVARKTSIVASILSVFVVLQAAGGGGNVRYANYPAFCPSVVQRTETVWALISSASGNPSTSTMSVIPHLPGAVVEPAS
jgi:hypothetical protein